MYFVGYMANVKEIVNLLNLSGTLQLAAGKTMKNDIWPENADSFSFKLSGGNQIAIDKLGTSGKIKTITKSDDSWPKALFDQIMFNEEDEAQQEPFIFIISEVIPEGADGNNIKDNIKYSGEEFRVSVHLTDDGEGTITPEVTLLDGSENGILLVADDHHDDFNRFTVGEIENEYISAGRIRFMSSKHILNKDGNLNEEHTIPFDLWYKPEFDAAQKNAGSEYKPFISNDVTIQDDGTTHFDYPIEYTLEDPVDPEEITDPDTGGKIIRVSLPGLLRMSQDPEKPEMVYVTKDEKDGKTTWKINYYLTEKTVVDQELYPPDQSFDIIVTLTDDGKGTITPTEVNVTDIIKDKGPGETRTINLTDIKFEDGTVKTGFSVGEFENRERQDYTLTIITGTKRLDSRALTADDKWSFVMTSEDGGPLPKPAVVQNNEKGEIQFAPITFTANYLGGCKMNADGTHYNCGEKVYHYSVREEFVDGEKDNSIILDGEKKFSITVFEDPETGNVKAIADPEDLGEILTFTNTTRSITAGEAEIAVEKLFNGEWPDGMGFTFTITPLDEAPMSERSAVTVTKDDPSGSFGKIRITVEDMTDESGAAVTEKSFSYEIREVIPEGADPNGIYQGIQYDTRVRTATISARIEGDTIIILSPADQVISETFTNRKVEQETPEGPIFHRIETMPKTGFPSLRSSVLKEQPKNLSYRPMAFTLQIPSLDITADIVEVPYADGEYPVEWLGSSAGLLEGFALPGKGQTFITGHNHLNTMEAGPFALLNEMGIGDRIFVVDPENKLQIFTVYANEKIAEKDIRGLERIAGQFNNSMTLITCEDEMESGGYANRRIIACKPVNK